MLEDGTEVFPNDLIDRFANGVQEARKSMEEIFPSDSFLSLELRSSVAVIDAHSEHRVVPFLNQSRRHNVDKCNAIINC